MPSASQDAIQSIASDSHIELATAVRRRLERDIVYTRGEFYRYESSGIWEPLARDFLARVVYSFDGAWIGKFKLRLKDKTVQGVINVLANMICDESFFDKAPDVLVFKNGVVEITGKGVRLGAHTPANRATFALPCAFDPKAPAERFRRALGEWFEGDSDTKAKQAALQEFTGAALLGRTAQFQRALMLTGRGANGKSVFLDILAGLFPDNRTAAIPVHDFAHPYFRAQLSRCRINICAELPEAEVVASEAFKAIVSGDSIACRDPMGRPFKARPRTAIVFATNNLPRVSDTSEGFWRRLILVPFNRTFEVKEQIAKHVLAREFAGLCAWAVEGAQRVLAADKITVPASSGESLDAWRRESDSVALWVHEKCAGINGPESETAEKLYVAYKMWADSTGHKAVASNVFGRRLGALGVQQDRTFKDGRSWRLQLKLVVVR